jgi:Ser/Thr protein kinase RdoA (MazF antagonist)
METQAALMTALHHWALPEPVTLRAAEHGVNNDNRIVQTPDGTYVLRIYRHTTAEAVHYEHALLAALGQIPLPFAIPTPVPTRDGATVVALGQRDGADRLLSLARFFPGEPPTAGNLAQARAGGAALGQLDDALASLPLLPDPPQRDRFLDLDRVHPAVPDAAAAVRAIPSSVLGDPDRLLALLERVQPAMLACYEVLSTQSFMAITTPYTGTSCSLEHGCRPCSTSSWPVLICAPWTSRSRSSSGRCRTTSRAGGRRMRPSSVAMPR